MNTTIPIDCFSRDAEDSKRYTIEELSDNFNAKIHELKNILNIFSENELISSTDAQAQVESYLIEVMDIIKILKNCSYMMKHKLNISHEIRNKKQLELDRLSDQYKNHLREKAYWQNEVTKCLDFKAMDDDIKLLPVEEFLKNASAELTEEKDEHRFYLNRLHWEIEDRIRLKEVVHEKELQKEKIEMQIKLFKKYFKTLKPKVAEIIEATKPLQTKLDLAFQALAMKDNIAEHLPLPLYYLYIQMATYNETCDSSLEFSVLGDVDEARAFERSMEHKMEEKTAVKFDADGHPMDFLESSDIIAIYHDKDLLKKHPLSVRVLVTESEIQVALKFYFLFHLNVVTVNVEVLFPNLSPAHDQVLEPSEFFNCLYSNDYGLNFPNPTAAQLIVKYGYDEECDKLISHNTTGWPYYWVQKLSGLYFLSGKDAFEDRPKQSASDKMLFVEEILLAIKQRMKNKVFLYKQITSLANKTLMITPIQHLCPLNIICELESWTVASWSDIETHPNYEQILESGAIHPHLSIVYKAGIKRGSAKLIAYIIICPNYPVKWPLFLLALFWNGQFTNASDFSLREIEEEVNIRYVEDLPKEHHIYVLTWQVHHLLACFDIFLETRSFSTSSFEFPLNKAVAKINRGPHQKPFKYNPINEVFSPR